MQLGGAGIQTSNLPITRQFALPPELQPQFKRDQQIIYSSFMYVKSYSCSSVSNHSVNYIVLLNTCHKQQLGLQLSTQKGDENHNKLAYRQLL